MPCVLIADDEPMMRQLIRETLSADPALSFIEVDNGLAALEQAGTHHPELIILDIMMPQMNGIEAYRAIRADPALSTTPVILVTAYGDLALAVVRYQTGPTSVIKKPFEDADLMRTVSQALQINRGQWGSKENSTPA
jgi:CheY-like chemotaxis protein